MDWYARIIKIDGSWNDSRSAPSKLNNTMAVIGCQITLVLAPLNVSFQTFIEQAQLLEPRTHATELALLVGAGNAERYGARQDSRLPSAQ